MKWVAQMFTSLSSGNALGADKRSGRITEVNGVAMTVAQWPTMGKSKTPRSNAEGGAQAP